MITRLSPRPDRTRSFLQALVLSLIALIGLARPAAAVEEPDYRVVRQLPEIEVREYGAYVVAETIVDGPADAAGGQAFSILAGYIFGKNKGSRKLEMTAPVTQSAAPTKVDMTAPVTQSQVEGGFLVQFVLPKSVTLATAPEPLDPHVTLREIPARRVAVIRYSGFWSQSRYQQHLARLQAAMEAAGLTAAGDPVWSRYDPPFMPWFLRRNEIWIPLADGS